MDPFRLTYFSFSDSGVALHFGRSAHAQCLEVTLEGGREKVKNTYKHPTKLVTTGETGVENESRNTWSRLLLTVILLQRLFHPLKKNKKAKEKKNVYIR